MTFPQLRSALLAGGLLAFALSFDEIIVTTFTAGSGVTTLPIFILNNMFRPEPGADRVGDRGGAGDRLDRPDLHRAAALGLGAAAALTTDACVRPRRCAWLGAASAHLSEFTGSSPRAPSAHRIASRSLTAFGGHGGPCPVRQGDPMIRSVQRVAVTVAAASLLAVGMSRGSSAPPPHPGIR